MFAVVNNNGVQLRVELGKEYKIDLIESEKSLEFGEVYLVDDDKETKVGTPFVEGAKVSATVVGAARGSKVTSLKFHAKKRYKRTKGHRQEYSVIKITDIKA